MSAGKGLIDSLAYDKNGNLLSGSREANLLEQGYAKANEWGERSSIAQTKGSMKAYGNDVDKMAQAIEDDSLTKAHGQMSGMNKARKEGLINEDGSLSDTGKEAFALQSNEAISALVGKENIGKNIDKAMEDIYNQAFTEGMAKYNNIDKAKEHAESRIAPFMKDDKVNYNSDGSVNTDNALTGIDFWNKNAELKAGSFSGSNSIMLGGGSIFSGGLGQDGEVTGTVNRGLASKTDNSAKVDSSSSKKTGEYLETGSDMKAAKVVAEMLLNKEKGEGNWTEEDLIKKQESIKNNADLSNYLRSKGIDLGVATTAELTKYMANFFGIGNDDSINEAITTGLVGAGLGITGYAGIKKLVGNSKDKALFKDSFNKVDATMQNPKSNPNNAAQHQASQNSSHNSPPNKFIPDGFGRMKPNPEYELYQKSAEKSNKMAKYGTGSLVGMGMYAYDSWAQGKSVGEVFSDMKNVLSNKYNEYGNAYDVGTSLFVGDDAQRKINATSNPFKAVGYTVMGMANTAVDGAYAISAVAANTINGLSGNGDFKQNYQNSMQNQTYNSGLFNAVYGSNINSNVFANNAQQTISYNTGEQTAYLRDVLSGQEENQEKMDRFVEHLNNTTKR
ncbi:hypothetical protein CRU94_07900 [Arcobacter sp. AHV-9/2010]|uniref:hypothetical protein n=1 Tax=Arcobacter sp. AHV-9/2010 TaxID=2021861 RepID=UPI00100B62A4|nr:hypothetical protein [Arcobacter sp. CECT 9299]RXJ94681.1 hypothetical protein CRU94_07900 [Arcobacter sp. CECT 9299]